MKIRMFFRRMLLALLVVLCLGPGNGVLALSKPSQAGQKVLSGGQRDFRWPVPGAYNLSSCFLDYRRHYAIDIAADSGTTVIASYPGTVVATYTGCRHNYGKSYNCCDSGFGNYVVLKHDYTLKSGEHITLYSQYAHLTSVSVSAGQRVSTGTKVGTVGSTGYSTGPHLDYQILKGGYRPFRDYSIDPYINELLELPKGLHTTFGGCCQDYVAYVKKLYPHCTHGRFNAQGKCTDCDYYYNWKSTKSPAVMGNYKVNAAVTPKKIPYSAAENAAQTLSAGATVSVSASYTNGSGERWYALTANGADFGYVPKSAVTFSSYWESQYSGKITAPSNEQTLKQQSYTLKGTVSSRYPLRKVSGYLDGKCYATWSGSGSATSLDFTGTDINNKLFFSKLTPGKHTLTITAADATGRGETKIAECVFYIQAPPSIHTVTLEFCDGTTQAQTLQRQDGYALGSLPTPEKEGYLLDGWFTEAEGGTQVTEDSAVTKSMTLYAQWTPLAHTVTMEDTQLSVSHGQTITQIPVPSKTGHQFLGWYTESGLQITESTPINQDWVLSPRWTPTSYHVTLDPGEGTVLWNTKQVTYQGYYGAIPVPTRAGYTFAGWFYNGVPVTAATAVTAACNHTLTAAWSLIEETEQAISPYWIISAVLTVLCAGGLAAVLCRKKKLSAQQEVPEELSEQISEEEPAAQASEEEPVTQE